MASRKNGGNLETFAKEHGLSPGTGGELPKTGSLLSIGHMGLDGACSGALPGGETGWLFTSTWETKSDDSTTTHRRTAVVISLPESLAYAPYLRIGGLFGPSLQNARARNFEPAPDVKVAADSGVDEGWLHELFSPAFTEWLQRSPEDFGAELDSGVLVVARDGHKTGTGDLETLCEDAARIAREIREESLQEVEMGGGSVAKAQPRTNRASFALRTVETVQLDAAPPNVESTLGLFQAEVRFKPRLIVGTIQGVLLIMLAINIIGGGIYGLLLTVGDPLKNVLLYQVLLFVIVGFFRFRFVVNDVAKTAAAEAFWQGYERENQLTEADPIQFSAQHAQAGLPGKPLRVLEGRFGGSHGFVMITGDGRERGHKIALVRGPQGPTAVADLNVSAPGISTAALNEHIATLLLDLETAPPAPAKVGPA